MQSVPHVLSICVFSMSAGYECASFCDSQMLPYHVLYVIDTEPTHAAVCIPVVCELLVHLCMRVFVWLCLYDVCVFESAYDSSVL